MRLSANKRKRLAREPQDEREARLERTNAYQRERLARESNSLRICISTWSLQLRENEDFNVEEKESELIEQQRLQLKKKKG